MSIVYAVHFGIPSLGCHSFRCFFTKIGALNMKKTIPLRIRNKIEYHSIYTLYYSIEWYICAWKTYHLETHCTWMTTVQWWYRTKLCMDNISVLLMIKLQEMQNNSNTCLQTLGWMQWKFTIDLESPLEFLFLKTKIISILKSYWIHALFVMYPLLGKPTFYTKRSVMNMLLYNTLAPIKSQLHELENFEGMQQQNYFFKNIKVNKM